MKIPGYTISRRLGSGGQALVYLAIQESLERQVALKVLHPVHSTSPEFSARFMNEARILANLGHSNVITIHDIGVDDELHYLSMEYVEGGDLKQRIRAGLAVRTTLEYLSTIADCLATAHHQNVVHRDIKPGNVLFRHDGTLLLTDFGIAKQLDSDGELTISGTTMGSPHYLSPEQAQGRPLDGRADIYSLGAMAFEMLTGRKPYKGQSEIDTIFQHINAPVPRLPDELARFQPLIERSMAKMPEHRFENTHALTEYLRSLIDGIRTRRIEPAPETVIGNASDSELPISEHTTQIFLSTPTKAQSTTRAPSRRAAMLGLSVPAAVLAAWVGVSTRETPAPEPEAQANPALSFASNRRFLDEPQDHYSRFRYGDQGNARTELHFYPTDPPRGAAATARGLLIHNPRTSVPWRDVPSVPAGESRESHLIAGSGSWVLTGAAGGALTSSDGPSKEQRIAELLSASRAAFDDLRLTLPKHDNAYSLLQSVLELDPDNTEALAGIAQIAERYADMAELSLQKNRRNTAGNYVRRGLSVDPRNENLLAIQSQLTEMQYASSQAFSEPEMSPESFEFEPHTLMVSASRRRPPVAATPVIHGESPQALLRRIKGWFE